MTEPTWDWQPATLPGREPARSYRLRPFPLSWGTLALRLMTENATRPDGYGDAGFPAEFYDVAG